MATAPLRRYAESTHETHSLSSGYSMAIWGRAGTSMISMNMTIMAMAAKMAKMMPFPLRLNRSGLTVSLIRSL